MVADMQEDTVECPCLAFGSMTGTLDIASFASLGCVVCCHIKTLGAATDGLNSLESAEHLQQQQQQLYNFEW